MSLADPYHIPAGEVASYAAETVVVSAAEVSIRVLNGGVALFRLMPGAIEAARADKPAPVDYAKIAAVIKASDSWGADTETRPVEFWTQHHGVSLDDFRALVHAYAGVRGPMWEYHERNRVLRSRRTAGGFKKAAANKKARGA